MLVLKGDNGKSKFINSLLGENICFEYCEYSVNLGGFYASSLNHSIDEFKDYIKACLYEEDRNCVDDIYNYLIVYTNEKEEDLRDFITWLKDNELWFLCRDIIVVCK